MEEHSEHFNEETADKKRETIRPEEYNNIHEKYTGGKQQQIRWCRTNQ